MVGNLNDNPLGQRIKIARKKSGLTQDKLAHAIGVAYPTLNKYERGHRIPNAELLAKMSETLQCDPGWLLVGEDSISHQDDPELAMISRILKNDLPEAKQTILRLLEDWKSSKKPNL